MRSLKNLTVLQAAFLLIILACWPLFHPEFFRVHDYTHVARLVEMVDALQVGHFPVHWSANFGYGYGMPLFLFYGPLPYYLASIPALIGFSALNSIKLLIVFTHFTAWTGMYFLLKKWGRTPAFIGASAFLFAPYRAVDLYVRGAFNELLAMSFLPWILYFSWQVVKKPKRGWLGVSLLSAGLVLTHNLTALISLPILFCLGAVGLWLTNHSWRPILILISSFVMGAALSLFYALPALVEKDLTIIESITSGYFDFKLHFLYIRQFWQENWGYGGSSFGPHDDISFHFGWLTLGLTILAGWQIIKKISLSWHEKNTWQFDRTKNKLLLLTLISGGFLGISLYMSIFKSQWLWEMIPLLAYIQFPWRFLAVANFLAAMLAGWSIWFIRPRLRRWLLAWLVVILLVLTQMRWHQPEKYLDNHQTFYYEDRQLIREKMSDILLDYLPLTFDRNLPPVEPENRIVLDGQSTKVDWQINEPHRLLFKTTGTKNTKIIWNIADFPGWKYYIDYQEVQPQLLGDGRRYLVTEKDFESVGAIFTATPIRQQTQVVSLLAGLIWLAVALPPFFSLADFKLIKFNQKKRTKEK